MLVLLLSLKDRVWFVLWFKVFSILIIVFKGEFLWICGCLFGKYSWFFWEVMFMFIGVLLIFKILIVNNFFIWNEEDEKLKWDKKKKYLNNKMLGEYCFFVRCFFENNYFEFIWSLKVKIGYFFKVWLKWIVYFFLLCCYWNFYCY